jgi:hypothetical protein
MPQLCHPGLVLVQQLPLISRQNSAMAPVDETNGPRTTPKHSPPKTWFPQPQPQSHLMTRSGNPLCCTKLRSPPPPFHLASSNPAPTNPLALADSCTIAWFYLLRVGEYTYNGQHLHHSLHHWRHYSVEQQHSLRPNTA